MINLAYDDRGSGDPVLFIAGRGGAGRTWHLHQVPAFQRAGYRVITFDNRGIGATENAGGFTTETMVADTAALIEELVGGPVRVVGVSMGSFIAQELMLARPELVSQAVLMATRGRHDRTRAFFNRAETRAARRRHRAARPSTTPKSGCWRTFRRRRSTTTGRSATGSRCSPCGRSNATPGLRCQLEVAPDGQPAARLPDHHRTGAGDRFRRRRGAARRTWAPRSPTPCPNGRYLQIPDTGHLGFIETPGRRQRRDAGILRRHRGV